MVQLLDHGSSVAGLGQFEQVVPNQLIETCATPCGYLPSVVHDAFVDGECQVHGTHDKCAHSCVNPHSAMQGVTYAATYQTPWVPGASAILPTFSLERAQWQRWTACGFST